MDFGRNNMARNHIGEIFNNMVYDRDSPTRGRGRVVMQRNNVICKKVSEIDDLEVRPQRAGVILYAESGGELFFGFGVDTRSQDLTDFGGGVSYKTDKTAIKGALREFEEESLGVFEPLTADQVSDCPVIYDKHNMIIFIFLDIELQLVSALFDSKYKNVVDLQGLKPEVSKIVWLSHSELKNNITYGNRIFTRVQNFLRRAGDFYKIL